MHRLNTLFVLLALLFLLPPPLLNAQLQPPAAEEAEVPDMLIVKFKSSTTPQPYRFANADQKATLRLTDDDPLAEILKIPGVTCFDRALGGTSDLARQVYCLRFDPSKVSMATLEAALEELATVEYIEHNMMLKGHQDGTRRPSMSSLLTPTPNDPLLDEQYNVQITRALEARALLGPAGGRTATVAVVDDAVYTEHEDLTANIFTNPGETGTDSTGAPRQSNGIDDDGNGFVDDWQGYDVADDDNDPTPPDSIPFRAGSTTEPAFFHGTHIAGVAAGVTDNELGIASLSANRVKIIPVKATPDSVTALTYTSLNIARGIAYAIELDADVVNLSLGSFFVTSSRFYKDLIDMGTAEGTLFVSSAGNNPGPTRSFPAALDNVLAVAGTNATDAAYLNTSYGEWVDVAGPAFRVLSTYVPLPGEADRNPYEELTGTSFSCPLVAGLAALLRSQDPSLTPAELTEIIKSTADNVDQRNVRLAGQLGAGRVNVYNALAAVVDAKRRPIADFELVSPTVYAGQPVTFLSQSLGNDLRYRWITPGAKPVTITDPRATVIYDRAGRYPVVLIARNAAGVDVEIKREFVTVEPVGPVDVVGFPFAGPLSVDSTPVRGATSYGKLLVYPEERLLTSVRASFFSVPETSAFNNVSLEVYRIDNGQTADLIYEQDIIPDSIVANGIADVPSYNDITLEEPVTITPNDTFLIRIRTGFTSVVLHRYPSNGFDSYFNFFSIAELNGADDTFSWLLFPTLVAPEYLPEPPEVENVCSDEFLVLDATELDERFDYSWTVRRLVTFVSLQNPRSFPSALDSLIFDSSEADEYLASLRAVRTEEVRRLDTTFTTLVEASLSDTLNVANCTRGTTAAFTASTTTVEEGGQITYTADQNTNATTFEWSFPGGQPGTASESTVTVTYPTAGVYDVGLTVSQDGDNASSLEVTDYIVVTDPTCNDLMTEGLPLSNIDPVSSTQNRLAGQGPDSLEAFGNLFTLNPDLQVYGIRALVARLRSDEPSSTGITLFAWDNDGERGTPGTVLARKRFTYSELEELRPELSADQYFAEIPQDDLAYDLRFDDPVAIPADSSIILGYEVEYGENGSQEFLVLYNFAGEASGETSFLRFPSGDWANYKEASDSIFNIRLGLGAIVGDPVALDAPTAAIEVEDEGPFIPGQTIRFSIDEEKSEAVAYRWEVERVQTRVFSDFISEDAFTFTLLDNAGIVAINETTVELQTESLEAGTSLIYRVTLIAVNACGVEDRATETFEFEGEDPFIPELAVELINAETGEVLFDFTDREENVTNLIYLEDPTFTDVPLSLRTTVTGDSVGSIGFSSTETFGIAYDDSAPYELVGDQPGQIEAWDLPAGDYFFSAVAFTETGAFNGEGERGPNTRVRLLVYDSLMIPLEIIPLCSDDPEERRWEVDNANITDVAFEYQFAESDEWLFSSPAPLVFSTRRRIITSPVDSGTVFRIRWLNEVGEFEFAEATATDEPCPVEGVAQVPASADSESAPLDAVSRVYPNPTTGLLTIAGLSVEEQSVEVRVMDALGRLRLNQRIGSTGKLQLDLGHLPTGVYYVLLRSGDEETTYRVVRQ